MKKRTKVMGLVLCAVLLVVGSVLGTLAYLTSEDSVKNSFSVGDVKIKVDEAKVNEAGQPLDKDGNVVDEVKDADRRDNNDYHLIPGHTYVKDPTLTVLADSEESYIRMLVVVEHYDDLCQAIPDSNTEYYGTYGTDGSSVFLLEKLVSDWDSTKWPCYGITVEDVTDDEGNTSKTATYEFRYHTAVSTMPTVDEEGNEVAAQDKTLEPLFKTITVPGFLDNAAIACLDDVTITVVGHAIQADGFADTVDADGNTTATAEENAWIAFGKQTSTH